MACEPPEFPFSTSPDAYLEALLPLHLQKPPRREQDVFRCRLLEEMDAGRDRKLTLICAPAGYGKTTLAGHWIRQQTTPSAWLTFDPALNDHGRFFAALVAAFQQIHPQIAAPLTAEMRARMDDYTILGGILADLGRLAPQGGALVLDQFQALSEPRLQQAINLLIDYLPPTLHLLILTREDHALSLGRLRIRAQLQELRAADLRFSRTEIEPFLAAHLPFAPSGAEIDELERVTGGWAAGLAAAALYMGEHAAALDRLKGFNGRHRYVSDYLEEEVLRPLPVELRQFLGDTAILDHLTPSLCDAVTQRTDSQTILDTLEQKNLFIHRLDGQPEWRQYQELFLDFLRARPNAANTAELHHRASAWFEQHHYIGEAARHALAAGDLKKVSQLSQDYPVSLVEFGEPLSLMEKLGSGLTGGPLVGDTLLDDPLNGRQPSRQDQSWLALARTWTLIFSGKLDRVDDLLTAIEQSLTPAQGSSQSPTERATVLNDITAIRAYRCFLTGDYPNAIRLGTQAYEHMQGSAWKMALFMARFLGKALRWTGRFAEAEALLTKSFKIAAAADDYHDMSTLSYSLAILRAAQGSLRPAEASLKKLAELPRQTGWSSYLNVLSTGLVNIFLGGIQYEWNQIADARRLVQEGIRLCEQRGRVDELIIASVEAARILQRTGETDSARALLTHAGDLAEKFTPHFVRTVQLAVVRAHLINHEVAAAQTVWEEAGLAVPPQEAERYENVTAYLLQAQLCAETGSLTEASQILELVLRITEPLNARREIIEALALQAVCQQKLGRRAQAIQALTRALALGEPDGYLRTFLDQDPRLIDLIGEVCARLPGSGTLQSSGPLATSGALSASGQLYARRILASAQPTAPEPPPTPAAPTHKAALIEPLSERELEILAYICAGFTNQEISAQLNITLGTTKWHTVNIFSKLGVHSRSRAILRAREYLLVPADFAAQHPAPLDED
jgi:LuxR family maltose regulon positive regulatory protein